MFGEGILVPRFIYSIIALAFLSITGPALAQTANPKPAATEASKTVTPDQAKRALETLQDEAKRKQMVETLSAIANAAPAAPEPATKSALPLNENSLAAQLMLTVSEQVSETSREIASAVRSVIRLPTIWYWLTTTANDPATLALLVDLAWKLVVVFGCAFGVSCLLNILVRRPLALIEKRLPYEARVPAQVIENADPPVLSPDAADVPEVRRRHLNMTRIWQSMLRLPFVFGRLFLELIPVVGFSLVATLLLSTQIGDAGVTRLAILYIVNAYLVFRCIICGVRALVGPMSLFTVREETSAYVELWTRRVVGIAVTGIALANVALLLGLHRPGFIALLRVVMLAVHLLIVVVILQCRRQVADVIRPARGQAGLLAALRERLASLWHVLAIAVVLALWAVWALSIRNGYSLMLQYFVGTLVVVALTRLVTIVVLGLMDRAFRIKPDIMERFPGLESRANLYLPIVRRSVSGVVGLFGLVALLEVWGIDALSWFQGGQIGSRLASALFTIGIAAAAAVAAWEGANAVLDRKLAALSRDAQFARAARLRTFRPMLRTALLSVIVTIVALTTLSEIGVNVAPLLAGAGIVGIAIGFGSQKLVQDVITGLFLLLENVAQVGDNVTVSGLSGVVENVSIRTIRLRAGDGAVHIVPFSAVTTITNASRGAGNAAVRVDVAANEDTDRVSVILKEIVAEMRAEPEFQSRMRSDLELWGVDKVDGLVATLAGQIRCTDSGRWPVQREFNRRLKIRFAEEGIELAGNNKQFILQPPAVEEPEAKPAQRRAAR